MVRANREGGGMGAAVEVVLEALGIIYALPRRGWIVAKCPYHDDHDPSWRIRVTDHRYGQHKCWPCGSGGSLTDLVMHVKNLEFKEARAWMRALARGGAIERDMPEVVRVVVSGESMTPFELPYGVTLAPLKEWVTPARKYMEARAVTAEQVDAYRLGYAVDGKLAGRIVIPIYMRRRGALVPRSFNARDYTEAPTAKRYLYPSRFDNADLDVVFGQHTWPDPTDRFHVIVTEGAFDALAVERAGDEWNVAAIGGSQLLPAHVGKLATFKRVTILTDNNMAGNRAAKELDGALCRHTRVERVTLAEGTDANKTDPATLREILCRTLMDDA